MRASELADLAGTTVRTIRHYHHLGLLPVPERGSTWRSYGFTDLTRLMRVRWLVESGVPLRDVPDMLRPPGSVDERTHVLEDLSAVAASIDARVSVLLAQRAQVQALLDRVATQGRLSPIPPSLQRLYAELSERTLDSSLADAMMRERDLLELACYRGAVPVDIVTLADAIRPEHHEALLRLWEDGHRLNTSAGARLTAAATEQIDDLVREAVEVARRIEPAATARLLVVAARMDRPAVRAAVNLAYPAPVYRQFFISVVRFAAGGAFS